MPSRSVYLQAAAPRSSTRGAAALAASRRVRTMLGVALALVAVAVVAGLTSGSALAAPTITDPSGDGSGESSPALCHPATKLATPWLPGSAPQTLTIPGLEQAPVGDEGPHIGTAISIHHGPDITVRPLAVTPKRVERTSRLGFTYRAPGASTLRAWVVMNHAVAKVAYPYLTVGAEPVKLGVRTVQHPREAGGKVHVKLNREAAFGVGPFLRVPLTLCAAATGPNGNVTVTGRTVTLEAF